MPSGWGAAPSARSTPTLPTRAKQDVGKDTPKKLSIPKTYILLFISIFVRNKLKYINPKILHNP
ncbi:MAG: hypothetical protein RML94_16665 [Bacteroidia bacterium]|nr:hypothetical protein [Bacteroidia bacterium]